MYAATVPQPVYTILTRYGVLQYIYGIGHAAWYKGYSTGSLRYDPLIHVRTACGR